MEPNKYRQIKRAVQESTFAINLIAVVADFTLSLLAWSFCARQATLEGVDTPSLLTRYLLGQAMSKGGLRVTPRFFPITTETFLEKMEKCADSYLYI